MNTKKSGHLKRVIAAGLSVMMFSGYVPTDVIPDSFALVVAAATTVPMQYDFYASTNKLVLKGGEYSGAITWGTLNKRQVHTIEIEADREVKLDNCIDLFKNFSNVQTIDLTGLDTTAVTSMGNMFSGCGSLTSVTFGDKFDTSNVTNMSDMFDGCASLESVDITKFVTNNVADLDLSKMFNDCESLTELDIGDMDTSKATVAGMLTNCSSLEKVIVGKDANIEKPITFPVVTDTDTYIGWVKEGTRTPVLTQFSGEKDVVYILAKKNVPLTEIPDDADHRKIDKATAVYIGQEQAPAADKFNSEFTTKDGYKLFLGTDYTITATPGRNVGSYNVTVTGKAPYYTGSFTYEKQWSITPATLEVVYATRPDYTYNGKSADDGVNFVANGLVGTDADNPKDVMNPVYKWYDENNNEISAPINAGKYYVDVTVSNSNYTPDPKTSDKTAFNILKQSIADSTSLTAALEKSLFTYDGTFKTVKEIVTDTRLNKKLTKNTDYTFTGDITRKDANTYTATVTGKGNYDGKVDLIWVINRADIPDDVAGADGDKTYDGAPVDVDDLEVGPLPDGVTPDDITYVFKDKDGNPVVDENGDPTTPTDAGEYTVYPTIEQTPNYNEKELEPFNYTINKADIDVALKQNKYTYNGETKKPEFKSALGLKEGKDFRVVVAKSTREATNAGKYTIVVEGINNYKGTRNLPWTIEKANIPNDVAGADGEKVFDGKPADEDDILINNLPEGVTPDDVTYVWVDEDGNPVVDENGDPTTPTDVGTYTVTPTIGETPNYKEKELEPIEYTISPVELTASLNKNKFTYNGKDQAPVVTVTPKTAVEGTLKKGKDYTITGAVKGKKAGKYVITVQGIGNCKGTIELPWEIEKAPIPDDVKVDEDTKGYDGTPVDEDDLVVENLPDGVTPDDVKYEWFDEDGNPVVDENGDPTTPTDAGEYTVVPTVEPTDNYDGKELDPVKFEILPAMLTASLNKYEFRYTGEELKPIVTVGLEEKLSVELKAKDYKVTGGLKGTEIGEYKITVKSNNSNYTTPDKSKGIILIWQIIKGELPDAAITVDGKPVEEGEKPVLIYDGDDVGDDIGLNWPEEFKDLPEDEDLDVTFTFFDEDGNPVVDEDGNPTAPTDVGTYTVVADVTGDNFDPEQYGPVEFEIAPMPITATLEPDEFTYDGEEHSPAVVVKPTDTDSPFVVPEDAYTTKGDDKGTAAGDYELTVTPDDNFVFVDENGDPIPTDELTLPWKIKKAPLPDDVAVVVDSDNEFEEDGEDAEKKTTVDNLPENEDFDITYDWFDDEGNPLDEPPTEPGDYKVVAHVDDNPNYEDTDIGPTDFKITPADDNSDSDNNTSDKDNSDKDNSDKDNSDKDNSDKDNSDKDNSDKDNSDKDTSDKDNSDKDNSDKDNSDNDNSDKDNSDKDNSDKDNSDKDNSDKDNSDKDNSDKDNSDKDNSDKDNSDKDNSDKDNSDKDNSDKDNSDSDPDGDTDKGDNSDTDNSDTDKGNDSDTDKGDNSDSDKGDNSDTDKGGDTDTDKGGDTDNDSDKDSDNTDTDPNKDSDNSDSDSNKDSDDSENGDPNDKHGSDSDSDNGNIGKNSDSDSDSDSEQSPDVPDSDNSDTDISDTDNSDTDNSDTDNSDTDTEFFWQIGDVNMDHKITAKDSLLLQRGLLKLEKLSKAQFVLGEVNFDGRENNRDALEILRYTIKLHDENHIGEEIDISPYL